MTDKDDKEKKIITYHTSKDFINSPGIIKYWRERWLSLFGLRFEYFLEEPSLTDLTKEKKLILFIRNISINEINEMVQLLQDYYKEYKEIKRLQ